MHTTTFAAIAAAAILAAQPIHAGPMPLSPPSACRLLAGSDLGAGEWKPLFDDRYFCASRPRRVGPAAPLPNALSYHVTGNARAVTQFKLALDVNQPAYAAAGHMALSDACNVVAGGVMSRLLPPEITTALRQGRPASAIVGDWVVTALRDDWPSGRGYSMACTVE